MPELAAVEALAVILAVAAEAAIVLVAFVTALFVVRFLLDFVSRHGFAPFAWWRIVVGVIGLGLIWGGVG